MVWDRSPDEDNEVMMARLRKSKRLTIPIRGGTVEDFLEVANILDRLSEQIKYRVRGVDVPKMSRYDFLRSMEGQIDLASDMILEHFKTKGIIVRDGGATLKEQRERREDRGHTEQSGAVDKPLDLVEQIVR